MDEVKGRGGRGSSFYSTLGRLPASRDLPQLAVGGLDRPELAGQRRVEFFARREELMPVSLQLT